jgi:mRNA interferase RelE/StbE
LNALASPKFKRLYKNLHANQRKSVNGALDSISLNPQLGDLKVGSLAGVRVHKFKILDRQWLLAYELVEEEIPRFIYVGPHENFYRDLTRR